jgi:nucleotide-binding universal stress UspA family protein
MRVVCGIDASRADANAVREACALAGPDGLVALVCIRYTIGAGATAQTTITPARATTALERAMKQARTAGVRASAYLLRSAHVSDALLRAAADGDVLVVGTHGGSRAGGIALGSVTTNALHRATVPVLVARSAPSTPDAPILVASDGSPRSDVACALAGIVSERTGAQVELMTSDPDATEALDREAVELTETLGRRPGIQVADGDPVDAILTAASDSGCRLLVVGSSGRTGLKALGSVSERVAHRAPCSVLVARPKSSRAS